MKVFIRVALEPGVEYGGQEWVDDMEFGWAIVDSVGVDNNDTEYFHIKGNSYKYTAEMVDWPTTNKEGIYSGQSLYIRDDLVDGVEYGSKRWTLNMKRGEWVVAEEVSRVDDSSPYLFSVGGFIYSREMVDWNKTKTQSQDNVVKEGMQVYLKDDLQDGELYSPGEKYWLGDLMKRGEWVTVRNVFSGNNRFHIINGGSLIYTSGMIDWDKTLSIRNKDTPKEEPKIKFILKRYDNYLVFQVIQQCDSITAKNIHKESLLKFTASNGFEIWSTNNPWIAKEHLCIGGSVSKTGTTVGEFKSTSEAKEVMEIAIKALSEWKANNYFTRANEVEEIEIASDGYYEL